MKACVVPVSAGAGGFWSWLSPGEWASSAILRRLGRIAGGTVELREGAGERMFGEPGADLRSDLVVRDRRFYGRFALSGGLGAAEAFINGWWESSDLPSLFRIFARNMHLVDEADKGPARLAAPFRRLWLWMRRNTRRGSVRNICGHYDLGNDLFSLFLDETMTYSSGIFENEDTPLGEASIAKIDRLCDKLELSPRDHLLEIGTGWGALAMRAAAKYGCRVTTTTLSREQHEFASRRVAEAGLADRVAVQLRDYRDLEGKFDKLVSVEMIEAVGHEYLPDYFRLCSERLSPGGLMAIQAITVPDERYECHRQSLDFIQKHIFPGSCVPSVAAMTGAIAASDLRLFHLEEFGPHYALTLQRWRERFLSRLENVRALGYTERFIRMWDYYLAYCQAGFAEGYNGVVQMVLTKPGCRRPPILPPIPRRGVTP